jgi:hypothetical protein
MHAEISLVEEFIPETMMIAEAGMFIYFLLKKFHPSSPLFFIRLKRAEWNNLFLKL